MLRSHETRTVRTCAALTWWRKVHISWLISHISRSRFSHVNHDFTKFKKGKMIPLTSDRSAENDAYTFRKQAWFRFLPFSWFQYFQPPSLWHCRVKHCRWAWTHNPLASKSLVVCLSRHIIWCNLQRDEVGHQMWRTAERRTVCWCAYYSGTDYFCSRTSIDVPTSKLVHLTLAGWLSLRKSVGIFTYSSMVDVPKQWQYVFCRDILYILS